MVAKRNNTKKSSVAVRVCGGAVLSCALVACLGMGIASAGAAPVAGNLFGISSISQPATASESSSFSVSDTALEDSVLTTAASRDISQGIADITAEEKAKKEAEEAARQAKAQQSAAQQALQGLSAVDWSDKDAFIAEWTERINNYLAGSPLAGYGETFATAAWENQVDPRWSPAISNTESSKGANCFLPHNAWGWGQSSWGSWEQAINAHVAGLAQGYGYTISYDKAKRYCPPNYDNWYHDTLSQMKSI